MNPAVRFSHAADQVVIRRVSLGLSMATGKGNLTSSNQSLSDSVLRLLLLSSILVIPIFVSPAGKDSFRLPKLLLLRGVGVAAAGILIATMIYSRHSPAWRLYALPLAILLWTLSTTLASSNVLASLYSFFTVLSVSALFFAAHRTAASLGPIVLVAVIVPALVNASVYLLQLGRIWNPLIPRHAAELLSPEELRLLSEAALLGNRNDIGSFLTLPAIVAAALAFERVRPALLWAFTAGFLFIAILYSRTLTAIGAAIVGLTVLGFMRSRKTAGVVAASIILATALAFWQYAPLRRRAEFTLQSLEQGRYDQIVSSRITPFLAAWQMGLDHWLLGVGPGRFSSEYFNYKLSVVERFPTLLTPSDPMSIVSWGETHNDFLQFLAEGGFAGLLLYISALVAFARPSFRQRSDGTSRQRLARTLAFPAAASLGVLSLAQFPLQVAPTIITYTTVAAACLQWSES